MRPRRANAEIARHSVKETSMRPRRARLGCRMEPQDVSPACPHFNEAEARAPRMLGIVADWISPPMKTSMRPRRARLGCAAQRRHAADHDRDFNEAEARAPRMPGTVNSSTSAPVSDFNEAEARAPRMPCGNESRRLFGPVTSMRPRRARLGCLAIRGSQTAANFLTSMRPRRARLGCPAPGANGP